MGLQVNHALVRFEQSSLLDVIVLAMRRDFEAAR
jgi:hypothetical protein